MKVWPYYSPIRGLAVEDLWHDNNECELGRNIARVDRRSGKGRLRKYCQVCQALNQPLPTSIAL